MPCGGYAITVSDGVMLPGAQSGISASAFGQGATSFHDTVVANVCRPLIMQLGCINELPLTTMIHSAVGLNGSLCTTISCCPPVISAERNNESRSHLRRDGVRDFLLWPHPIS